MTEPDTPVAEPNTSVVASHHICPDCGKQFPSKYKLTRHIIVHAPPTISCPTCGHRFRRESDLHRHMNVHDPNAPKHVCDGCGGRYSRRDVLLRHMSKCPTGISKVETEVVGENEEITG